MAFLSFPKQKTTKIKIILVVLPNVLWQILASGKAVVNFCIGTIATAPIGLVLSNNKIHKKEVRNFPRVSYFFKLYKRDDLVSEDYQASCFALQMHKIFTSNHRTSAQFLQRVSLVLFASSPIVAYPAPRK